MNKNLKKVIELYEDTLDFKDNKEILKNKLNITRKKTMRFSLLIPSFSFASFIISLIISIKISIKNTLVSGAASFELKGNHITLMLLSTLLLFITIISTSFYIKARRKHR